MHSRDWGNISAKGEWQRNWYGMLYSIHCTILAPKAMKCGEHSRVRGGGRICEKPEGDLHESYLTIKEKKDGISCLPCGKLAERDCTHAPDTWVLIQESLLHYWGEGCQSLQTKRHWRETVGDSRHNDSYFNNNNKKDNSRVVRKENVAQIARMKDSKVSRADHVSRVARLRRNFTWRKV